MTNKPRNRPKAKPTWSDVKDRLADFDRARLLELVADFYAFHSDNKSFLHARFGLGANPLDDYKRRIGMALAPDVFRKPNGDPSVATAKRAIAEYAKAVADPLGLLELRVFWCETAVGFSMEFGFADERYLDALLRQYRDACQALSAVDEPLLGEYIGRLAAVRDNAQMGYGVQEEMSDLLGER